MLEQIATIRLQANTDYLTKLPNRRYFFEETTKSLKQMQKKELIPSLAMLDIDHFKAINDTYGHDAGDEVLKGLSICFAKYFTKDLAARLGGEEFAVYFNDTNKDEVLKRLNNFRHFVELNSPEFSKEKIQFTLSIGYAHGPVYQIDELLKQADIKLYEAKATGRNKVIA
jgi:diguanylate cyclase (GGDEF)-like protein